MATSAQLASAGVYVTDDVGVEVTDGTNVRVQLGILPSGTYGLRVISADGTSVIIDGTSDIWKVGATGTLSIASPGPANGTASTALIDDVTPVTGAWQTATPVNLWFTQGEALPYFPLVLPAGTISQVQEGFTSAGTHSGSPITVKFSFRWTAVNMVAQSATVRYYGFTEVTL
ncbi:MAG TPA: hypothetical protein VF781_15485 [Solirubrobacteraceae bacterium]